MSNLLNKDLFEQPNPFGECTLTDIMDFERKFSIVIPETYKNYLCQFNGAKPINNICTINNEEGDTTLHHMYGLHNNENYRIDVKRNLLIFADDTFGNHFAINLNQVENYGHIYFIDHELDKKVYMNKDFSEFILSLYSKSKYLDRIKLEDPVFYARLQALKNNPQI